MKSLREKGITLIALVITIIVLLILAGVSIATLTGNNGILTQSKKSKISTELSSYKEQVEIYKQGKYIENNNFLSESLTAGKENLFYNTQPSGEEGNIKTIIENISDEYLEKMEIIKGELLINTQDKDEVKIAQGLGIEVNPYDIVDGVLLSSNGNLLLMDKNGTLTVPDSVTEIGEGSFANLNGLKTIIIPSTVKRIAKNAFAYNATLEKVIIQDGVEEIGDRAFTHCSKLKEITLPDSITKIGIVCFQQDVMLDSIKLPKNLKVLENNVFSECSNLKNIELSKNLEELHYAALRGTAISSLKFPPNLKIVEDQALQIPSLQNIDTSENNYYTFKNGVLYSKDIKTLVIALSNITKLEMENTTETITSSAFARCNKLISINITENVKTIGLSVFNSPNLKLITVDENNDYFMTDERNNLYSKDGKILYRVFDKGNIIIRDGVENVKQGVFSSGGITGITLPESYIGDRVGDTNMFPALEYLYLPKKVVTFNKYSYPVKTVEVSKENPYLESVDNNQYILSEDGTELYWVKSDLKNVNIPETVKTIKNMALLSVEVENIVLPESIEKIERNAFYNASTKKIEIQKNIKEIDSAAFSAAESLSEVIIHKNKNDISGSPWSNLFGERAIFWVGE